MSGTPRERRIFRCSIFPETQSLQTRDAKVLRKQRINQRIQGTIDVDQPITKRHQVRSDPRALHLTVLVEAPTPEKNVEFSHVTRQPAQHKRHHHHNQHANHLLAVLDDDAALNGIRADGVPGRERLRQRGLRFSGAAVLQRAAGVFVAQRGNFPAGWAGFRGTWIAAGAENAGTNGGGWNCVPVGVVDAQIGVLGRAPEFEAHEKVEYGHAEEGNQKVEYKVDEIVGGNLALGDVVVAEADRLGVVVFLVLDDETVPPGDKVEEIGTAHEHGGEPDDDGAPFEGGGRHKIGTAGEGVDNG